MSFEASGGTKVLILVQKEASSKFDKMTFKIGDIVYIKAIHGDPWENNSDLIWVTKDKEGKSRSYGFRPEELALIKPDSG